MRPALYALSAHEPIRRRALIAFFAVEQRTDVLVSPFVRDDPWPVDPRRVMAHVLIVAALELGDPILMFVL
jgi:hypothetical protein